MKSFVVVLFHLKLTLSCLPTQQVEGEWSVSTNQLTDQPVRPSVTTTSTSTSTVTVTTTTTTTTSTTTTTPTTTTTASFPCSVCPMIYEDTCLGGGFSCALASQVGIIYMLGPLIAFPFGDANTCSTVFSCPLPTASRVKLPITGTIVPGPSLVIATCQETGANAGVWYYGIPPVAPVEIVGTTCEGVFSG